MGGGTEAFPDLGWHCQHQECNQLDFLPFKCDCCRKVFCVEHRSTRSHDCPKSDVKSRRVLICKACSMSVEITGCDDSGEEMRRHERSGCCDPAKKKKPVCVVSRCREVLTFSNTSTCRSCGLKVCLKHRFPPDHGCEKKPLAAQAPAIKGLNNRLTAAREGSVCAEEDRRTASPPTTPRPVKAW